VNDDRRRRLAAKAKDWAAESWRKSLAL